MSPAVRYCRSALPALKQQQFQLEGLRQQLVDANRDDVHRWVFAAGGQPLQAVDSLCASLVKSQAMKNPACRLSRLSACAKLSMSGLPALSLFLT